MPKKDPQKDPQVIDQTIDLSNDDEYLQDDNLEALVEKEELTETDMTNISKLIYSKRIYIFRQRSLRTIAKRVQKEIPNKFTKKELKKISHVYETRSKDKIQETIDLIRHKEKIQKSSPQVIQRNSRTRLKTKRNEIEGYDTNL